MASSSDAPLATLHPDLFHAHILSRLTVRLSRLSPPLCSAACASTTLSGVKSALPRGPPSVTPVSVPSSPTSPPATVPFSSTPSPPSIAHVLQVHRTQTHTGWFECSPLWIDLLGAKESVPTPLKYASKDEDWMKHLEENLSLSWILIDTSRNRAANLSSRRPVSAQRHWLTGELELVYAVVIACDERPSEWVQCNIKVTCTCGEEVGGEMRVKEVSLTVEDTDGRSVSGKQSMAILQSAVESGKRRKVNEEEAKARFEEFLSVKRDRREKQERRDQALDMVLIVVVVTMFAFLCWFFFF
ncbi:probable F-box protein At2g36090 [Neltuma alba]|uniref:probable F-box protein At2g36090 n=1 Tax=Neltuma alba TaxID=207710 RepID=UPI0010A3F614|nr:probable F-box protein At2g36090 [Prosopis alba]